MAAGEEKSERAFADAKECQESNMHCCYSLLSFVTSPVCTRTMFEGESGPKDQLPKILFLGSRGHSGTHTKRVLLQHRIQAPARYNFRAYVVHLYVSKLRLDKFCNHQMLPVSIHAWLKKNRAFEAIPTALVRVGRLLRALRD